MPFLYNGVCYIDLHFETLNLLLLFIFSAQVKVDAD